MKPTRQSANIASTSKTGPFALLAGLLRAQGIGASKVDQGTGASKAGRRLIPPVLATTLGVLAFTAAPALAVAPETPETGKANSASVTATTVTLEDGVLNPHTALGELGEYEYRFRVSATECEGESSTAGMALGDKEEAVPPVDLTNLQPNAHYTFCLFERSLATQETSLPSTPEHFTTKPAPPTVESESFSSVKASEARLEGTVNPNNQVTECKFQYEAEEPLLATPTTALCEPGALVGSFGGQSVGLNVGGLEAGKTYYYRAIAENEQSRKEGKPGEGQIEHFTTAITVEAPETKEANPIDATEATLNGVLNPNGERETEPGSAEFRYRQSATTCEGENEKSVPVTETLAGKQGEAVKTAATDLSPNTEYAFCLLARNAAEETATGPAVTFVTPAMAPTISGEYSSEIEATTTTLNAVIDPGGATTAYLFEYLTQAQYEADGDTFGVGAEKTIGAAPIAADNSEHPIIAYLKGLQPGMTYDYRAVASNSQSPVGGTPGPDATFATNTPPTTAETCPNAQLRAEQPYGQRLPECRAYEQVTPPYKEGYEAKLFGLSADGDTATLSSLGDLAGTPGDGEALLGSAAYLDTRTSAGWKLTPLNPPSSEFVGQSTEDLVEVDNGLSLWEQHTPQQSAHVDELYIRSAGGVFAPIGPLNTPLAGEEEPNEYIKWSSNIPIATTSDFRHVVLKADNHEDYWPFDPTQGEPSLYEYSGTNNRQPLLVGVTGQEKSGNTHLVGLCGTYLGNEGAVSAYNALSADGETIFFTPKPCGSGPLTAEVYARLHGSVTSPEPAETVDVSASECTRECGSEESGKNFEGASESGELVFFTSTQKLTNGAVNGVASGNAAEGGCAEAAAGEGGCNLYEYDFATPGAECQREHKCLSLLVAGEVLGVAGIAEDGARVYFVSREALAGAGANPNGQPPQPGGDNLYVYDTESRSTAFIATLGGGDETDWRRAFRRPVQVTGEGGRFLLFASSRPDVTPGDENIHGQVQLFEYAAAAGGEAAELVRVTQGEGGFDQNGNGVTAGVNRSELANETLKLGYGSDYKTTTNKLSISRDGRTVAFETAGQLSPYATAAASGCTSVYVFHAPGPLSQGSVHLISDGVDVQHTTVKCGASFVGMDATGANVLFATDDSLLASDVDEGQRDTYDARVDGGFPQGVGEGAASCEGVGCEGTVSTPALFAAPGSSSLGGAGNFVAGPPVVSKAKPKPKSRVVKCRRGRVRRGEKCVRKPKARAKKSSSDRGTGR